jgi:hypothetical protein
METQTISQAGLGIFGWLIVVIAVTFIWNMISKKKETDKEDSKSADEKKAD